MIRSEWAPDAPAIPTPYPVIKTNKRNNITVLFTQPNKGMVIRTESIDNPLGMFAHWWDETAFDVDNRVITLTSSSLTYPHLAIVGPNRDVAIVRHKGDAVLLSPNPGGSVAFSKDEDNVKPVFGTLRIANRIGNGVELLNFTWEEFPQYPVVKILADGLSSTRTVVLFVEPGRGIELGSLGDTVPLRTVEIKDRYEDKFEPFHGSLAYNAGVFSTAYLSGSVTPLK